MKHITVVCSALTTEQAVNSSPRSPIILVANNPFGHHLLTSQLLDIYEGLGLDTDIILLCNGIMANAGADFPFSMTVVSFASPKGAASSYANLLIKLIGLRRRHPRAVYHLRGFVSGMLFFLSRLSLLQEARYIYDPRGAFFIEWCEAGRPKAIGWLMGWVESRLIRHSVATIVTSERFARVYRRLFGHEAKYLTIYNSTSFAFNAQEKRLPSKGNLRFVYLGTFNHWHDMNEVVRVMANAARQIHPNRIEIFIYTLPKFHEAAKVKFGAIDCAALNIEYVNYHDIPQALADKHIGVSVVRPTLSSRIASPIKISDYVALGLVPLLNKGIGDFDAHFRAEQTAILYKFGQEIDVSRLKETRTAPNKKIYCLVSQERARMRLAPVVERLRNG